MPFVRVKVSCEIKADEEIRLKELLGRAITLVPGKDESCLLLGIEDCCHLWLGGKNDSPIAYIEAAVFGNEGHAGYPAFTREVTAGCQEILGIRPENVYIRFEDIPAWGVAGQYVDRRMFR